MSQKSHIHPSLLAAQEQFKKTLRNQPLVVNNKRKPEHVEPGLLSSRLTKDRVIGK